MRHHLTIKYLLALLAMVLLTLPQVANCQEEEYEFEDPNQAEIDSLIHATPPNSHDSIKAKNYCTIAKLTSNLNTKQKYAELSLEYCKEADLSLKAYNFYYIAMAYWMKDEERTALQYYFKTTDLADKLSDITFEATTFIDIGNCYKYLNIIDSTFYYYNIALKKFLEIKDTSLISYTYQMIGNAYYDMNLYSSANDNYQKSLEYATLSNDTLEIAETYYLMGANLIWQSPSLVFQAIDIQKKAVLLFESKKTDHTYYIEGKYEAYAALSRAYIEAAKLTGKKEYADSCYMYIKKTGNYNLINGAISNYVCNQFIYVEYLIFNNKNREALAELMRLEEYIDDNTSDLEQKDYHNYLFDVYCRLDECENALKQHLLYDQYRFKTLNDSTFNTFKNTELERTRMIEELKRENAEKLHAAEKRRLRVVIISLWVGLGLVVVVIGLIFRVLVIKKRSNAELSLKNELLSERKEEIETQRDTIKAQSDEIQASINYARRIQYSLLTPDETISRIFPDHFLLYKPRNVVSGDYYWIGQYGDNKVCLVADCTGHGVPGGFLSVLGMSNLNYIVGKDVSPDAILNRLREAIIANLRQTNNEPSTLSENGELDPTLYRNCDGMDAAVYIVNERLMNLSFAGANNPLVLIRGNEIQVLKADKMPVGIYARITPFECTTIDLQKGDCIYTYSDGFQDQFGDGTTNKFTAQRLRDLLLEIHAHPMAEQKDILNHTFEQWRGPADNQTDDVLIMGVRV
ncbi:MAG: SpoIIE family protein phosphatase [Salinivirgaceae bacterium]|nr:SpoIIE family protein phosphatase [Salinivirgaceae bacterium]